MLWLQSFHIIFMVTWFAGLFYLPRLFVYHAMANDAAGIKRLQIMEHKLFWGIMTPGGILTSLFGFWMLILNWGIYMQQTWIYIKLGLIMLLVIYHIWCGMIMIRFKHCANRHSHTWYRWFNEIPTVALTGIVLLAVLKQPN